jgi:putative transposase
VERVARGATPVAAAHIVGDVPRSLRCFLPGTYEHLAARGTGGCALFVDDHDRVGLASLLDRVVLKDGWIVHAWCFMTNHIHFVVEAPRGNVSQGMHRLSGTYARRFNERHARRGHLFAERFTNTPVKDEEHLAAACAYVLDNPVSAGLVPTAEAWPWSACEALGKTARIAVRVRG